MSELRLRLARAGCAACLLGGLLLAGCAGIGGQGGAGELVEAGEASYYGLKFHGRRTANGEIYDMFHLTAAHRELPFGSIVEVRNLDNGRRVQVRINDRGPFRKGRIIDLSYRAARRIDMVRAGTARVELRLLHTPGEFDPASRFEVQVGAFRDAPRAAAVRERLVQSYEEVRIDRDGAWHRVLIGPFADRARAEDLRAELLASGFVALVRAAD